MENKIHLKNALLPIVMLSLALGLRQMSMTIVMPFISTYCKTLSGYTPLLAGLALGMFGLMQAIFQIPFGVLSDKYGNKKMLLIGLSFVVIGLVIAGFAKNIAVLIFARGLQGSGAVIGVAYSWAAGMTDESRRTKAMSILGGFISVAAALAFAIGPLLRRFMPVSYMFLSCAVLLFINELYICFFIKDVKNSDDNKLPSKKDFQTLLHNKTYVIMNLSAFINNFMMISVFYGIPIYLNKITTQDGMWRVFVPAIIIAIIIMKAAVVIADKGYNKQVLTVSFLISSLSLFFYFKESSYIFILIGTTLFLGGYISLATIIATNVNNVVEDSCRGTANGIFNSFQYIGNFAGSIAAAALWGTSDKLVWIIIAIVGFIGLIMIASGKISKDEIEEVSDSI